jgi:hypothetical protein
MDDGNSHYYVGMYTYVILPDGKSQYILLGLQPPVAIGSFTADAHIELIPMVHLTCWLLPCWLSSCH